MRVGQRRRPIWRIEQTSALENVWLVLFFDQRWLLHFVTSVSVAAQREELGPSMGVWNSRRCDAHRHLVFLGWPQKNGPRAAFRAWLFARNVQ